MNKRWVVETDVKPCSGGGGGGGGTGGVGRLFSGSCGPPEPGGGGRGFRTTSGGGGWRDCHCRIHSAPGKFPLFRPWLGLLGLEWWGGGRCPGVSGSMRCNQLRRHHNASVTGGEGCPGKAKPRWSRDGGKPSPLGVGRNSQVVLPASRPALGVVILRVPLQQHRGVWLWRFFGSQFFKVEPSFFAPGQNRHRS